MILIYNIIFFLLYIINAPTYINAEFELDLELEADSYMTFKDFNFEGNLDFNKPYVFVPLGLNCWPAQALRMHGFRDTAFPFDWLFTTDNDGLATCLNENFEHFSDPSCFIKFGKNDVENICYNFRFIHDWPHNGEHWNEQRYVEQLQFIKNKYARRITRFNNLRDFKGKIFFIRAFNTRHDYIGEPGWNTHNVQKLHQALQQFFPMVDFTLVVISLTDPKVPEIDPLEGVIEYKIDASIPDGFKTIWAELKNMFTELTQQYESPH